MKNLSPPPGVSSGIRPISDPLHVGVSKLGSCLIQESQAQDSCFPCPPGRGR